MKNHITKKLFVVLLGLLFFLSSVKTSLAHVVVKPAEVGVAAFQTFTIGVPNEKDNLVVNIRLEIPEGLNHVSPNVKPGWTIETKKSGEGEDAKITEIEWKGGSIPEGQRDDFAFSAQVPAQETILSWKAYQTYQDGTVVSWDQKPDSKMSDDQKEEMEKKNLGPYSQTKIINDLKTGNKDSDESESNTIKNLSIVALVLSAAALVIALRKR